MGSITSIIVTKTHTFLRFLKNPKFARPNIFSFHKDVITDTSNNSLSFQAYFMKTQLKDAARWHEAPGKPGSSWQREASSLSDSALTKDRRVDMEAWHCGISESSGKSQKPCILGASSQLKNISP